MGKCIIIASSSASFIEDQVSDIKKSHGISEFNVADFLQLGVDQGQSIGIKQIRVLKAWAQTKPFTAKGKLAWISNAQLLTIEAQNSLLKLLEEPPLDVSIILSCDNHQKLLPTVNSRCQLVHDTSLQKVDNSVDKVVVPLAGKLKEVERLFGEKDKARKNQLIKEYLLGLLWIWKRDLFHADRQRKSLRNIALVHETLAALDSGASSRIALESLIINLEA